MKKNKFAAVIIAAGYSSRMNGFKPLLTIGNETAVEKMVNTYQAAGVDQIILVLGHQAEAIRAAFENSKVECVLNENFNQGMYTSIVKGIGQLEPEMTAFFINPVDIPLVKVQTIKTIMKVFGTTDKGILYPVFFKKRGHPPLIHRRYEKMIIDNQDDGGLKQLLEQYPQDSQEIAVADEAILMDMDTPEDYKGLLEYHGKMAPNLCECYALMELFAVTENILRHCLKVREVAMKVSDLLLEKKVDLDTESLKAAALLHDIQKCEPHHAERGARVLSELGYEKIGNLISTHMEIEVQGEAPLSENEILYLSDKLVMEDQLVNPLKREDEMLKKFRDNPAVVEKIKKRYQNLNLIRKKIEGIIGKGLWDEQKDLFGQAW